MDRGASSRPCPFKEIALRDNTERIRTIQPGQRSLARMINQFKATTTRRIRQIRRRSGELIWQRGYNERIIRNEIELDKIRHYIRTNPRRP